MIAATTTYRTVATTSEPMIPNGISRCGLTASSAVVDTASNPTKARKTIAAAVITPLNPNGMNGCQFPGFTYQAVSPMKIRITVILTITITRLTRALSLIPRTSSHVSTPTISTAGRFRTPESSPHGAAHHACGSCQPNGLPRWLSRLTRYADQPIATRLAPTMYSVSYTH